MGAEVGSTEVSYIPTKECIDDSPKRAKILEDYVADTGTAGSVALLLQTSFLPALVGCLQLSWTNHSIGVARRYQCRKCTPN